MKCGREPGGERVADLGVCPSALETRTNGINDGLNGGRACWVIAGTLCGGQVQGTFAAKLSSCLNCRFRQLVVREQGDTFVGTKEILSMLTSDQTI